MSEECHNLEPVTSEALDIIKVKGVSVLNLPSDQASAQWTGSKSRRRSARKY
jgi:hypothetical protein